MPYGLAVAVVGTNGSLSDTLDLKLGSLVSCAILAPLMTPADLLAEAEALMRPCVRLSAIPNGGKPVAFWGAERVAGAGHLLSVDLASLPTLPVTLPRRGIATLRMNEHLAATFAIEDTEIEWSALGESQPELKKGINPFTRVPLPEQLVWEGLSERAVFLFAYEDTSLPAIDRLFADGGPTVRTWLQQLGWKAEWGYNGNFPAKDVANEYQGRWLARVWGKESTTPTVGRKRTFATIGGWRVPLLYEEYPPGELVLTALASTEPLVDVWRVENRFECDVQFT